MFQENLFAGKRILVTGGGTGLGKVMAEKYAELGAEVIICGRRVGVLEATAKEISAGKKGRVHGIGCDIREPEAVEKMVAEIWSQYGPLTGLVNNAAGNFVSRTQDLSPRGFNAIANIVFHGTFYVTHAVGKRWIEEKIPGSVISILVTWIWTGGPYVVPSAMSKAAIHTMTQSLAAEWGKYGIRLNAIAPGPFPTKGASERLNPLGVTPNYKATIPMGRTGEMPELSNLAAFLMADGCQYLTGQTIAIDGGQWLAGNGNFYQLSMLTDDMWKKMKDVIKSANEKDKAQRTA
ncbi:MAG: SDR family oxidoreductase [Bdellovibrionota bacterium]